MVSVTQGFDEHACLSPIELTMRDVIKSRGGALDARALEDICTEKGLDLQTVTHYLRYSPVFAKHRRGVWALCG